MAILMRFATQAANISVAATISLVISSQSTKAHCAGGNKNILTLPISSDVMSVFKSAPLYVQSASLYPLIPPAADTAMGLISAAQQPYVALLTDAPKRARPSVSKSETCSYTNIVAIYQFHAPTLSCYISIWPLYIYIYIWLIHF